ncbi:MAG TPA: BON domain-containing protein [Candidimonas sp.]|nr:BON domain-containing protein [Candidimonas sp.]
MQKNSYAGRRLFAAAALAGLATLSGCGLLVVGGTAATTAMVATDRRTAGEQVEDQAIEMKVAAEMRSLLGDAARVNAASYAGLLLLTGDVPTQQDKQRAEQAAAKVEKVKKVINELRIGDITPVSVRTNDTWLTSKVKTTLINTKHVPTRTILVTTERGVVYLLGKVTQQEAQMAATAAAGVGGVNKVVKLFQIVSAESVSTSSSPAPIQDAGSASSTTSDGMGDAPQALPVQ